MADDEVFDVGTTLRGLPRPARDPNMAVFDSDTVDMHTDGVGFDEVALGDDAASPLLATPDSAVCTTHTTNVWTRVMATLVTVGVVALVAIVVLLVLLWTDVRDNKTRISALSDSVFLLNASIPTTSALSVQVSALYDVALNLTQLVDVPTSEIHDVLLELNNTLPCEGGGGGGDCTACTNGTDGDVGPVGPAGSDGDVGPVGPAGDVGPAGADGGVGATGDTGGIGPAGPGGNQHLVGAIEYDTSGQNFTFFANTSQVVLFTLDSGGNAVFTGNATASNCFYIGTGERFACRDATTTHLYDTRGALALYSSGVRAVDIDSGQDVHVLSGGFYVDVGAATIEGALIVSTGDFAVQTGTATIEGALTVSTGNFVVQTGTATIQGDTTITAGHLDVSTGNATVATGHLRVPIGTATIGGDTTITTGDFRMLAGSVFIANGGVWVDTGDVTISLGDLVVSSGSVYLLGVADGEGVLFGPTKAGGGLYLNTSHPAMVAYPGDGREMVYQIDANDADDNLRYEWWADGTGPDEGTLLMSLNQHGNLTLHNGHFFMEGGIIHVSGDWRIIDSTHLLFEFQSNAKAQLHTDGSLTIVDNLNLGQDKSIYWNLVSNLTGSQSDMSFTAYAQQESRIDTSVPLVTDAFEVSYGPAFRFEGGDAALDWFGLLSFDRGPRFAIDPFVFDFGSPAEVIAEFAKRENPVGTYMGLRNTFSYYGNPTASGLHVVYDRRDFQSSSISSGLVLMSGLVAVVGNLEVSGSILVANEAVLSNVAQATLLKSGNGVTALTAQSNSAVLFADDVILANGNSVQWNGIDVLTADVTKTTLSSSGVCDIQLEGSTIRLNATTTAVSFATLLTWTDSTPSAAGPYIWHQTTTASAGDFKLFANSAGVTLSTGSEVEIIGNLVMQVSDAIAFGSYEVLSTGSSGTITYVKSSGVIAITLDASQDATFAGDIILPGLVDTVDVSAFKADYDSKVDQAVKTTSSPTFVNVLATGGIGVGTLTPLAPVHVENGGAWTSSSNNARVCLLCSGSSSGSIVELLGNPAASTQGGLWFTDGTTGTIKGRIRYEFDNDRLEFWTNSNERMHIASDGNVGINHAYHAAPLDVNGVVIVRGDADNYNSEQIMFRFVRYGRSSGTAERNHYITAKTLITAGDDNYLGFHIDDGSTADGTSHTETLRLTAASVTATANTQTFQSLASNNLEFRIATGSSERDAALFIGEVPAGTYGVGMWFDGSANHGCLMGREASTTNIDVMCWHRDGTQLRTEVEMEFGQNVGVQRGAGSTLYGRLDVQIGDAGLGLDRVVFQGFGSTPQGPEILIKYPSLTIFNGESNPANNPASFALTTTNINGASVTQGMFMFGTTRATSVQTSTNIYSAVSTGDGLGSIIWTGDDGTDMRQTGASISVEMVGTATSNYVPAKITYWAESTHFMTSDVTSGNILTIEPTASSANNDAKIEFNHGRGFMGYFGSATATTANAMGIESTKDVVVTTSSSVGDVYVGNTNTSNYLTITPSDMFTDSSLCVNCGSAATNGEFEVYGATTMDAFFEANDGNANLYIHSSSDSSPGKDACLHLGSKETTYPNPDNTWYMCIDGSTGPTDWSPSLVWGNDVSGGWQTAGANDRMILENDGMLTLPKGVTSWGATSDPTLELGVDTSKSGVIRLYGTLAGVSTIQSTTNNLHLDHSSGGLFLQHYSEGATKLGGDLEWSRNGDGIIFNNPDGGSAPQLDTYTELSSTLGYTTGIWATAPTQSYRAVRIGNMVTLQFQTAAAVSNTVGSITHVALPTQFHPGMLTRCIVRIFDVNVGVAALMQISTAGIITIYADAANGLFAGVGACGLDYSTCSYLTL